MRKNEIKVLVWRTRSKWENNFKVHLKGIEWGECGLDSSGSGWRTLSKLLVPYHACSELVLKTGCADFRLLRVACVSADKC